LQGVAQASLALTFLAAAAADVEAEAVRLVAADLRQAGRGKDVADLVEDAGVGSRVRARRSAEWPLIDLANTLDALEAGDFVMRAGRRGDEAEMSPGSVAEDITGQGAFPGAADTGKAGPAAEGERNIDVLEVVMAYAADSQPMGRV